MTNPEIRFWPNKAGHFSKKGFTYFSNARNIRVRSDFSYLKRIESLGLGIAIRLCLQPQSRKSAQSSLKRMIADRVSELRVKKVMQNRSMVEEQVAYLRRVLSMVEKEKEVSVRANLSFRVSARHPVLLREKISRMNTALDLMGIMTSRARSEGRRSIENAANPFLTSRLNYLLDSSSAAGIVPISFSPHPGKGIFIGMDESNEYPVFLDIFSGRAYNAVVCGETGSGKSYFVKLLISRMARTGMLREVVIIDPLREYRNSMFLAESAATGSDFRIRVLSPDSISQDTDAVEMATSSFSSEDARKMLVIDEFHRMMQSDRMVSEVDRLVRHSRHSNLSVVLITQNLGDFLSSDKGRSILGNSAAVFSFRGKKYDAAQVIELTDQDTEEMLRSELAGGKTDPYSECIYFRDKSVRKMRVICTKAEFEQLKGSVP
jgi:DNA helicase HerA-like ATPase